MEVRLGERRDLEAIVRVYNHHVLHVATFDESAVSVEERTAWFEAFAETGPHRLVVVDDDGGGVAGYACSMPYRSHPAFAETVEFSVYLSPEKTSSGLGSLLYGRLLEELANEPVHRALVGIALPNEPSIRLHRRFGFTDVGVFDEYAKKWSAFISSLWMQRPL